jgi:hypothetical protein
VSRVTWIALAVPVGIAALIYLLGAAVIAYLTACTAPRWLREHPGALGAPARRAVTVASIVLLWPCWLLALGYVRWSEHGRCPFGECALWGWRTPGAPGAQALVSVYRCPHRPTRQPTRRPEPPEGEAADVPLWLDWYSSFLSTFAAIGVGALAAIPIPGNGSAAVWAAVTATTVVPLDLLAEELLQRRAAALRW